MTDKTLVKNPEKVDWKKSIVVHLLSYCLMATQVLIAPMALAEETDTTVEDVTAQRDANAEHERQAENNDGLNGSRTCDEGAVNSIYDRFQQLNEDYTAYTLQSTQDLRRGITELANQLGTPQFDANGNPIPAPVPNLLEEQEAFISIDQGFAGNSSDATPAQIEAYDRATETFIAKSDAKNAAERRYNAARRNCRLPDDCTTAQRQELNQATAEKQRADREYSAAYTAYKAARSAIQNDGRNSIDGVEDPFFAKEKRYEDSIVALDNARMAVPVAEQELNAAQSACADRVTCSPAELARITQAQTNLAEARNNLIAAQTEYNTARNAFRRAPVGMAAQSQDATNNTANNANAMNSSHSISGCGGSLDITVNASGDCSLSGPLFDRDENITTIANRRINQAKRLAAQRADLLFDLELQQQFAADYRLYEMAVNGGFVDDSITTLEGIDGLEQTDVRKTKNLQLTISNIKTVGAASAVVKDMVCEQHDVSEVDSKSYYILRAAAATWLMAVVNDTDYYAGSSTCSATDALSGDAKNEQIYAVERAALLHDQQLESMCMRIQPKLPPADYDPEDPNDYKVYGNTKEEAARYVAVLRGYTDGEFTYPPLFERCKEYYEKIRGDEYANKPATREYAQQMVMDALELSIQELAAKREKIATAHANVEKGKAWVKRVKRDLMIMAALAAVVYAAYRVMAGICPTLGGSWACGPAAALSSKYVYITGTVIGIWLMSELARAQSFLAQWEAKLEKAKFFHHMACNFEDAKAEEAQMAEMGRVAKERKAEEIRRAKERTIRGINNDVQDAINGNTTPPAETTYIEKKESQRKLTLNKMNSILLKAKSEKDLLTLFSSSKNSFASKENLKEALRQIGLELMEVVMPSAQAASIAREERRDVSLSADALNIAQGTESFRYFLVQRNQQYQNLTNDITNQPQHSPADSEISPASGNQKNVAGSVLKTVDQLATPFMGGATGDPIADLGELERLGFPTPETRVATIQSIYDLFTENILLLNGGIAEVAWQRDQYVQLLTDMRKRMGIDKVGLGETQLIPNNGPSAVCMVGDVSSLNFDSSCGCSQENSCTSFDYPKFSSSTPDALKNGGRLGVTTANSLMSGNLSGAALNGGRLVANAAAVRGDLLDKNKKGSSSKTTSAQSSRSATNSNELQKAMERKSQENLAKLGVDPSSKSAFSRVRSSLLGNGGDTGLNDKDALAAEESKNKNASLSKGRGALAKKNAGKSGKDDKTTESFSLTEGSGNLNLEGLTDEERRNLGLAADGGVDSKKDDDGDRYAHVRSLSQDSSRREADKSDPFYGINQNRGGSLFKIISKRYEKTAFPVFLSP